MSLSRFSAIVTPARNFFSSISNIRSGVRQEATLLDLNNLVDLLNSTVFTNTASNNFVYRLTETLGVPALPATRLVGGGASSSGDCPSCTSGTDFDQCGASKGFYCTDIGFSANRTAPGVYQFDITNAPAQLANVALLVGNVATLGVIVNVTRVSNTRYTVTAVDTATGIAIDGTLTDVNVYINLW